MKKNAVLNNFLILYFQADASLELERRDFIRAGLEYVCLIQEVQERKKFEFVETVSTHIYFLGSGQAVLRQSSGSPREVFS